MTTLSDTISKYSKKDLNDYLDRVGLAVVAEKCVEVTNHIRQLTAMMGEVIRDESMACIVGGIEVHVICYGAGEKVFETTIGKTVESHADGTEEDIHNYGQQ